MPGIVAAVLERLNEILNVSLSHIVVALTISTLAALYVLYRERREWKRAQFESRINISLNIISNGKLLIRTINESPVQDVILSAYARKLIKRAAHQTTEDDGFLHFYTPRDAWLVYNEIINTISGLYGGRLLFAAMQKGAVEEDDFLLALTWERDADVRIQKLRVLMLPCSMLGELEDGVIPEISVHTPRINALRAMRTEFMKGNWPRYQTVSLPRT